MSSRLVLIFGVFFVAVKAVDFRIGQNVPLLGFGRIVGGEQATKGEFPHQVSLQWGFPPLIPYQHFCGGSIVDSQWIVTAGHCVQAVPWFGSFIVKAGKYDIKNTEPGEQSVDVTKSIVHENYTGGVAPNDIALLKLKTALTMDNNNSVGIINLPKNGTVPTGSSTLSGWGSVSPDGREMPVELQKAVLPIIDFETCKSQLEAIIGPTPLDPKNICTGSNDNKTSACSGDSGGPLIWKNPTGVTELIGVVSWGILPCGSDNAPSVYTDVTQFVDWIKNNIN